METCPLHQKQCYTLHSLEYTLINEAIVCVTIGLVLLLTAPRTPEIEVIYDDGQDADGALITKRFQIAETMEPPIYLYYGFTNYFQNHRRYLKYFSVDQMNGKTIDSAAVSIS